MTNRHSPSPSHGEQDLGACQKTAAGASHREPPAEAPAPPDRPGVAEAPTMTDQLRALRESQQKAWLDIGDLWDEATLILRRETPRFLKGAETLAFDDRLKIAGHLTDLHARRTKGLVKAQKVERQAHGVDYKQPQNARGRKRSQQSSRIKES